MNVLNKDHTAYYPIIVKSNDYIGNSTYRYTFPSGSVNIKRSSLALESLSMSLSYYNITTEFNNRIFTIGFPEGAAMVFNQLTIPEGYYTIESLNSWLQFWMISQNYYLIDDLGNYVYYVELLWNPTFGRVQLNLYDVPDVLPAGWTNPGPWTLPNVAKKCIFVVGESNNFGKFIGFEGDGLGYTAESQLGQFAPSDPVDTIIVQCTNLDNRYSNPTSNLYSFSTKAADSLRRIDIKPIECSYIDLTDGSVSYLDIRLSDQSNRNLQMLDTSIKLNLIIKVREEK